MPGLLLYIKFLLLSINVSRTKSMSVVPFAVWLAAAGFLMTGTNKLNVAQFCRLALFIAVVPFLCCISLLLPFPFVFPFGLFLTVSL